MRIVEWEFERAEDSRGVYGDGQILADNYRWLLSLYVLGLHFMIGRSAYTRPWRNSRLKCWLTTGHRREVNNPEDPSRRWWCPDCGKVWPE